MPTVAAYTFGCKLNHYETGVALSRLVEAGWREVSLSEIPDLVIIDTCTVTARADFKARQKIRQLRRRCPGAYLLVCGCLAQRDAEMIAAIPGVQLILGNREKLDPLRHLDWDRFVSQSRSISSTPRKAVAPLPKGDRLQPVAPPQFNRQTRGFLKIQDGCDTFCSFCIVPHVRGRSRSLPPRDVVDGARRLVEAGYRELVLTGVHIGDYGRDLTEEIDLARLLRLLAESTSLPRLRISSIEPWDISEALVRSMAELPFVMPHLHTAVQSGSDTVLHRMKRRTSAATMRETLTMVEELLPGTAIGTDLLTGFPGESAAEHTETRQFVQQQAFAYLHVFPFSVREGTPAARLPEQLPAECKRERTDSLLRLDAELRRAFLERHLHTETEVLVESKLSDGHYSGRTSHYIQVALPQHLVQPNRIVRVRLIAFNGRIALAIPVAHTAPETSAP